ncbi:Aste57867_15825 [Aphanomyces stellatus]|uniref:Purple acid phosphatase n=1 Tax=Aphanomyces stellatus TaxID=120398 RepID=A0A485L406_9STRA|nr:hypothetical protein As57867_015769 [Aphanomyces stellatus]VFT92613.1 Aste57867_15825 [Aphanomyces stellatus]
MKLFAVLALAAVAAAHSDSGEWIGATHHLHAAQDACKDGACAFPSSGRRLKDSSNSIKVSQTTIPHMTKVDVTFAVQGASKNDRVAAYCTSENVDATDDKEYIDFQPVSGKDTDKLTFGPLLNMRCDYQFRYQKAVTNTTFETVAKSKVVKMKRGDTEPLQIHIALTQNDDEMNVAWTSAEIDNPTLRVTIQSKNGKAGPVQTIDATSKSYSAEDMCSAPANLTTAQRYIPSGVHYDGVISHIPAGATVVYQVGSDASGWSEKKSFVMPDLLPSDKPSSYFVFGDMGTWVTATNGTGLPGRSLGTINRVAEDLAKGDRNYHAALHVGDLSYADSIGYIWEQFGDLIQPVASKIPYMVSVGNHEYCYLNSTKEVDVSGESAAFYADKPKASSNGECGVPIANRFNVPDNGNGVFWYSFDAGMTHQIILSSEHDFNHGSKLRQWLEADLAGIDRDARPWVFIHYHRPMYVSMDSSAKYTKILRTALEPLLKQYSVDAFFTGHTHAYERTLPVYNQTVQVGANGQAKGTVHVMIGSAGKAMDTDDWLNTTWSAKQLKEFGYGRVHVQNRTHTQIEFVLNSDHSVADTTWIVSDHKWGN